MRLALNVLSLVIVAAACHASPDDEYLRVAPDHWSFETRVTHTRFVPFGTNFVLNDKKYLNMFGPGVYDHALYDRVLNAMQGLGLNVTKVFLPIAQVLPDPQVPGDAHIAPGYLDNLADFVKLARAHHIRVEISLTEWGGNGIKWWHDGGEYFGRKPWRTDDGIDSLDVLSHFWTKLCTRFRGSPTIFSYTPAVEWTFPADNMTWTPPSLQWGPLRTEQGLFYWHAFLRARYGDRIDPLNAAYGTTFARFEDVPNINFDYDFGTHQYGDPDAKVLDYQNFREWASRRYFKPQIAALRAADPDHMVTISNHMRRPVELWEGAARYFIGYSEPDQSDLVDYMVTHDNHSESELTPTRTLEDMLRATVLRTRFCTARKMMPVIIEEYTFGAATEERTAEVQEKIVRATIGSASGWLNWYLQYPHDANSADTPPTEKSASLRDDLTPTAWGLRAKALSSELAKTDLSRQPAATTLSSERMKSLVPHGEGSLAGRVIGAWGTYKQPIDFTWPANEWLDMKLIGEK
jgi:hypothetical protein